MATAQQLSVGDVANLYGVETWKVRRTVDGLGIDVPRIGQYRLIPAALVPAIAADLRKRGWLIETVPAPITGHAG